MAEKLAKVVFLLGRYLVAVHCLDGGYLVNACCAFYATSAFRPIQQAQGASIPGKKARSLPMPAHPTNNAVSLSHHSITHRITIHITVPDTLELSESLWSLFCHAPQLWQTLVGCALRVINKVPYGQELQHNFTADTSAFRAPQRLPPLPSQPH